MAIDYTKLFTLIGKYVDKINDYYAQIATYASDQSAIETTLASEGVVRFADGLEDMFTGFKDQISLNISRLIDKVSELLTDEDLIGVNFSFGQSPNLDIVFPALIKDMMDNAQTIKSNNGTTGLAVYDLANSNSVYLHRSLTLDGVAAPMSGARSTVHYSGVVSQLLPTSETITLTCISDSESDGVAQGSEVFEITGTGAASDPYSAEGENIGKLGTITPVDNNNTGLIVNGGFDSWTAGEPDSWTNAGATTNYEEGPPIYGSGSSLLTIQDDNELYLTQTISENSLKRNKAYFVTLWCAKDTDAGGDQTITLEVEVNGSTQSTSITPTSTSFEPVGTTILIPAELTGDVVINVRTPGDVLDSANDPVIIDSVILSEAVFYSGVAMVLTCGGSKVLRGDTITYTLTNNNAGKFQTFFRKAYKVQLPSSSSPSISDSLVA